MANPRTVIAWAGLPVYGARLLRPVILKHDLAVIATNARQPFGEIETHLGAKIIWVDSASAPSWSDVGLQVPELFIHTGWNVRSFNSLAEEAVRHGAKRVSMVDNNWHGSLRQCVGLLVFRALMRQRFDRVIVPGSDGLRFMRLMGMPRHRVYTGMYGADPELFGISSECASKRPKRIVFVGQLIERKGIPELVKAWKTSRIAELGWELRCFGRGPLESLLVGIPGISSYGFAQADRLARELQEARVLILPSREEHWGVVVHEAALSGCALAVSTAVGAGPDLVEPANGFVFDAENPERLSEVFEQICARPPEWYAGAAARSKALARNFGPARWAQMFDDLVADLFGN